MIAIKVNVRSLGNHLTGVQRYIASLLPLFEGKVTPLSPQSAGCQGIAGHLWEQLFLPLFVRGSTDLLWSPANTGPLAISRQVLTIHDAATLDHPEWFESKFARWYRFLLPKLGRRCARIITVSQFSKERLLMQLGVAESKIAVVHNGIDPRFQPAGPSALSECRERFRLDKPYLLFVGSLEPRKNLERLLKAWQFARIRELELVLAGIAGRVFSATGIGALPKSVRTLGHVPDCDLPALYSGAQAFVFPSLYEGFGLPPLEAMACGCPVVVSRIPALIEVCGTAAFYFNPVSISDMARKLNDAASLSGEARAAAIATAQRRSREFTWARCADETWNVLVNAGNL